MASVAYDIDDEWSLDDFVKETGTDGVLFDCICGIFFPDCLSRNFKTVTASQLESARTTYWKHSAVATPKSWQSFMKCIKSLGAATSVERWKSAYYGNLVAESTGVSAIPIATESVHSAAPCSGIKRKFPLLHADSAAENPRVTRKDSNMAGDRSITAMFTHAAKSAASNKVLRHFHENTAISVNVGPITLCYRLHELLVETDLEFTSLIRQMGQRYAVSLVARNYCEHLPETPLCIACDHCNPLLLCTRHTLRVSMTYCTHCIREIRAHLVQKRNECFEAARKADDAAMVQAEIVRAREHEVRTKREKVQLLAKFIGQLELSNTTVNKIQKELELMTKLSERDFVLSENGEVHLQPRDSKSRKSYENYVKTLRSFTYEEKPIFTAVGDCAAVCHICEALAEDSIQRGGAGARKCLIIDLQRPYRLTNIGRHVLTHYKGAESEFKVRFSPSIIKLAEDRPTDKDDDGEYPDIAPVLDDVCYARLCRICQRPHGCKCGCCSKGNIPT
jgi:hypothetical protein